MRIIDKAIERYLVNQLERGCKRLAREFDNLDVRVVKLTRLKILYRGLIEDPSYAIEVKLGKYNDSQWECIRHWNVGETGMFMLSLAMGTTNVIYDRMLKYMEKHKKC